MFRNRLTPHGPVGFVEHLGFALSKQHQPWFAQIIRYNCLTYGQKFVVPKRVAIISPMACRKIIC